MNRETIDYIIQKFDGVVIDEYDRQHHKISGKPYDITFDSSRLEWSCDCKAFIYRRKFNKRYCKHILEIQNKRFALRRKQNEHK